MNTNHIDRSTKFMIKDFKGFTTIHLASIHTST